ncbi:MAG TPA: hypothetical protein VNS19_21690 [Acidimicrobiales bacterium]|nr:hypothetical protein [Acidimicrobiales bacterium]
MSDALLAATVPTAVDASVLAVDWTDHETWATSHTTKVASADPDARWGRRRSTGGISKGKRRTAPPGSVPDPKDWDEGKHELYFGYIVHAAVTAASPGSPELAVAVRVAAANAMDVGPVVVELTDALRDRGVEVTELLVDRGYSMRSTDKLHRPLAQRGVFLTYDYAVAQYGRHGTHLGAVLIGGEPHCPSTPVDITNRPRPNTKAAPQDWERYWADRRRLEAYAFRRLGRASPDLVQRYECPAAAGRVRCELRDAARPIPVDRDVPEIYDPPGDAPTCCTQRTFTVGFPIGAGYRQRHPQGSRDWVLSYDRRTSVERWFSSFKYVSRAQRDSIRVLGQARRTLMLTFAAVATNLRHCRNWDQKTGAESPSGTD